MRIVFVALLIFLSSCSFKKNQTTTAPQDNSPIREKTVLSSNISKSQSEFLNLVRLGTVDDLQAFLKGHQELDVNFKSVSKESPFSAALKRQDPEIINLLLNSGVLPFLYDSGNFYSAASWYSITQLRSLDEDQRPRLWDNDLQKENFEYFKNLEFYIKAYAAMIEPIAKDLAQAKFDVLRKTQLSKQLTCDQAVTLVIQSLQFFSSSNITDKTSKDIQNYFSSIGCKSVATTGLGDLMYNAEWRRQTVNKYSSPVLLNLILQMAFVPDYDISYERHSDSGLKFSPYVLISRLDEQTKSSFDKYVFAPFSIPKISSYKKWNKDKKETIEVNAENDGNIDFINDCVMRPSRPCNHLDYQFFFDDNPDRDDYYQRLNEED